MKSTQELKSIVLNLKNEIEAVSDFIAIHLIEDYPLKGLRPVISVTMKSGYSEKNYDILSNLLADAGVNTFEQTSFSAGDSRLTVDSLIFGEFEDFDFEIMETRLWANAFLMDCEAGEMRYHEEF